MLIFPDTETYNDQVDIKAGTYRYAETCELNLFGYMTEDDYLVGNPARVWDATAEPMPEELDELLTNPDHELVAWNSQFDRLVLHFTLKKLGYHDDEFGAPGSISDPNRWRCSMAKAMAHSLPGGLGKVGPILGIKQRKEAKEEGRKLVLRFCKPWKNRKVERYTRENSPDEWARYIEYCRDDVNDLTTIWYRLPDWNYQGIELDLWRLDQVINDRGIAVDLDLCHAAVRATDRAKKKLAKQTQQATNGEVQQATQRDKLLAFILEQYGIDLPDMQKSTIERRIEDPDVPEPVRELLALRLETTRTSTAKYKAFIKATSEDGRVRGMLAFCGAGRTGRWSGRVVQLQNLPRPTMKQAEIDAGIEAMKADVEDLVTGDVMALASSAIRGALVAGKGNKLCISDLANIEGRKNAWLAGEEWKLQAFRDYDAGTGPDTYKLAYSTSFGVPVEDVTKEQRQIGKVQELALGYQGAEGAFVAMGTVYGIDMNDAYPSVWAAASTEMRNRAVSYHRWAYKNSIGVARTLDEKAFLAACIVKMAWRDAHPEIVSSWKELEDTVKRAITIPATNFKCRRLIVRRDGNWLRIRLPSGRFLCYPQPALSPTGKITYMGINQYTRKWQKLYTYGGKLWENVTQASARDCLRDGMFRAEAAGYANGLTVHDELITEVSDSEEYSVEELSRLLATNSEWNEGLPLAAAGFETYRYRKE